MKNSMIAKRKSSLNAVRGRPHRPHSVAATVNSRDQSRSEEQPARAFAEPSGNRVGQRVLALKVEIDWKREESKALYNRLRDLGWMAARYRNQQSHTTWAQLKGWLPGTVSKHDKVSKETREGEKRELSGDVYSCAESEVASAWKRDGKKILAGQSVPEWKPGSALSIAGKEKKTDSGIRLHLENAQYILYVRAQGEYSAEAPYVASPPDVHARGNGWIRLPVAKHTKRDEWQGPILNQMVCWQTPIKKCTIHIERHGVMARLTYRISLLALPPMGERIATLGPARIEENVLRLHLRTETQTKDYSSKLTYISGLKDKWDKIRRRAKAQIGWRHGHARLKREAIARFALPDKESSCLHMWTREVVDWCASQGVGAIHIVEIATGDWPADRFTFLLKYKAEAKGIRVEEGSDLQIDSSARAARAVLGKRQRTVKQRNEAVRTIQHFLKGEKIA